MEKEEAKGLSNCHAAFKDVEFFARSWISYPIKDLLLKNQRPLHLFLRDE